MPSLLAGVGQMFLLAKLWFSHSTLA